MFEHFRKSGTFLTKFSTSKGVAYAAFGIFAFSILISTGCGQKDSNDQAKSGSMGRFAGMNRSQQAAIPVQVARVVRGDISTFLLHTTSIEAEKEVEVLAKVAGLVIKLPAEEGMKVKAGVLLAQLEEAELKIDLLQAKVRMQTDKAAFERAKNMLEKNLIAKENFETARLQFESSKAAYEAAQLRIEYTAVRSPIDGVVTARQIELGQRVNVNQPLFRVADFSPLRAKIYVPEKDMAKIFQGQKASITADAVPGEQFFGVVKMISPIVDPTNGTAKVTIDILNTKGKLKPGMFASVYITTDSHKNTLLIPKKALLLESQTDQVYINDNGVAKRRSLKLGFVSGDTAEVIDGLSEGEWVVTIGQEGLREGLPIRIPGQEITQAPTDSAQHRGQKGMASRQTRPAKTQLAAKTNGKSKEKVDAKEVARIEKELMGNPFVKRAFARAVQEDPSLSNDPAKKMAFFRSTVQRFEKRVMQNPMFQQEYEKQLKKDPELEKDLVKKMKFFRSMFRKMRSMR